MRRTQVGALAVAVGTSIILTTGCATANAELPSASTASAAPVTDRIVIGDGRDRTASQTVSDWVTYGDHVVVVTVVNEIQSLPSRTETERGEGMIGRTVRLRVDKVLWSAPDAPHPAPAILDTSAAGWVFNNNNGTGTVRFALRHSSRFDKGHTYIKVIEWIDDSCSDNPNQGKWAGLGSGGTIPFDGGVLGAGEFEGRVQTLNEATAKWQTDESQSLGVRNQMVGKSVDTLVANLKATSPRPEKGYWPTECNPSDR